MGTFKCRHDCGATCYSKNPTTRSVFIHKETPEDYALDSLRSVMSFNLEPDKYAHHNEGDPQPMDLVVRLTLWRNETSLEAGLEKLIDYMTGISKESIKRIVCQHSWEPVNGPEDYTV